MKSRLLSLLSLILLITVSYGFTDDDPLKNFLLKLERYRDNHTSEKIHIHTDKPYYVIGDTIWFKSYLVSSATNQLSALSKILYVELINEKDSVKKSLRLPVVSGLAWGDFLLTDSLTEGNYRIRSYTNWMRNFSEAYFFDKNIKIGNSFSSQVQSNVKFSFSKTGIKEHVDVDITYSDLKGKTLSGKEVTYEILLDHRNILKGKGTTDSSGNVQVKFTNAQPFILKSGKINTVLTISPDKKVSKVFPVKTTSDEVDVQFFPESGSLVNNIRTKVAFKAIGADGMSRAISGYVTDQSASRIAEFTSGFAGMGAFTFTPLAGNTYSAVVRFDDGSERKVALPKTLDKGYVLSINSQSEDKLSIRVAAANQASDDEVILVGQSNGIVHYVSKNRFDKNMLSATLSKKRFPAGIIQFTLFNARYQPLAERLVFIRETTPLNVEIKTDKATYGLREKVKLDIHATDSASKPARGVFSLSVTDESQLPFDDVNETTILSNLLLSSELKGYIEKPNYYFTDVTPQKNSELDNLMLTQGWRRFEWSSVASGNFPAITFKPEQSITVSGRILNPNGSASIGAKVSLLSARGTGMVLDTVVDAQGRFNFENLAFNDSTTFIVQARNAKDKKNVEIEIDRIPQQMVTRSINAPALEINVNKSMLPYLLSRNDQFDEMRKRGLLRKSIVLAEVKVTEQKQKVKNSSNLNGAGNADAVLVAKDLETCQNLAFCLQGRVAGLIVQNGMAYLTRSMYSSFSGPVPMQLVVDGMFLEPSFLSTINPMDVETIEVLKNVGNTAIYGMRGGGGVLIITTKRGERNMAPSGFSPGIASYSPQGYYLGRQFYSPTYETTGNTTISDFRSTILWAPNIITIQEQGKASLEFFTADKPGIYKAVLEGLDLNGSLTRQVYRFNVEE